ncbi:MAG: hypothetical protein LBK23_09585 [Oscillospiraceae bacterium]|jgi:hypothetical protein|nr:hypothetical protein [Oscillospiraceae bacterium]
MAGHTITEISGLMDTVYGKSAYPIAKIIDDYGASRNKDERLKTIFSMEKSTHFAETITSTSGFDGFAPVPENGAYPDDSAQDGYEKIFQHKTWKDRFRVSREMVDDDQIGRMKRLATKFVNGFDATREKFGAAMFGAALGGVADPSYRGIKFSTYGASADGRPLFDKLHPSKSKPSLKQSNVFNNPFSQTALSKMQSAMVDFRDDNGEILEIVPDTIIIPNDAEAIEIVLGVIGAFSQPDTSNNNWNYHYGAWNVIIWPKLNQFIPSGTAASSAFPYVLLATDYNQAASGAVWYDREPLSTKPYVDNDTDAAVWNGRARFSAGFHDWRAFAAGGIARGDAL